MAKLRYKKHPEIIRHASRFNLAALNEVDVGDDSAFVSELEVEINGKWKDMGQAFKDHDLIVDNYNTIFFEPKTPEDRERGFTLD